MYYSQKDCNTRNDQQIMIEESQQAMHYIYLFIFPSLCSYYLTGMIKELGLRLLVGLRLNLDTLKLVR